MELRHLRYFIAVAEELHFGRAAERLHMAQPPLSQQIRSLEEELGVQLLHRTKRRVQLTEAGQVFLVEARRSLTQIEQTVLAAQRAGRGEIGSLAMGFVSSASYSLLPELLQVFRMRFPDVELILHELTTEQQLQKLRNGGLDIGFLYLPSYDDSLSIISVTNEPLMAALPQSHPLTTSPQISLLSLAGEPFILPLRHLAVGFYDRIVSACQQAGFSPRVVQEANTIQTIISLVAGGIGISLVPASFQNLQRTGVIYKALQKPTPEVEMTIICRKNDPSPVLQAFLNVVRERVLSHEVMEKVMECPTCASTKIGKNGRRRGKQCYVCNDCGRQFIESSSAKRYPDEIKQQCLEMYGNGIGFRAISIATGVSHNTIISWVKHM